MKFIAIIYYLSNFQNSVSQLRPPEDDLSEEMKVYIMRTTVSLSSIYDTVGIIGVNDTYTRGIVTYLLIAKNVDAVLIGSRATPYRKHGYLEMSINLFCFVNTIDYFSEMIAYAKWNPFFNTNGFIQFIVGKPVTNTDWLMNALQFIWSNDIPNYVVVFQLGKLVEVIGYNQFNGSILNFTNHPLGAKIYPNKMVNLHGWTFRVGMIIDRPRNVMRDGLLVGEDISLLKEIIRIINGTLDLTIYKNALTIRDDLKLKHLHFSFTRIFTFINGQYVVHASYPVQMDYMVIAVPAANLMARYKNLFMVFKVTPWLAILISIVVMTCVNLYFARVTDVRHNSTSDVVFSTLQIFLNTAYIHIFEGRASYKILVMTWTIYSLLIATAFSTTLRSSLINLKYDREIKTIEDLKDSELKVAMNGIVLEEVLHEFSYIKDQLYFMNNTFDIIGRIEQHGKDMAYVLSLSFMQKLVAARDDWNRHYFNILEQHMIAGHNVYSFSQDSPYLSLFNNYILLFKQFGISEFGLAPLATINLVSSDNVSLTIEHLQSAFIILFAGFAISFLSLLIEHCHYMRTRKLRMAKLKMKIRHVVNVTMKKELPYRN